MAGATSAVEQSKMRHERKDSNSSLSQSLVSANSHKSRKSDDWGLPKISQKLVSTQSQLDEFLRPKDKWTENACMDWISNELTLCASDYYYAPGRQKPKLVDPRASEDGRINYLLQKLEMLGHLFADVVEKHNVVHSSSKKAALLGAVADLIDRVSIEFDLGQMSKKERREVVTNLIARLLWKRRLKQLLIVAARHNHVRFVKHLVESRKVTVHDDRRGITALHAAAACGSFELTKFLVRLLQKDKVRINRASELSGYTPLHDAAVRGREQVVRYLIKQDEVQINDQTTDGWTALLLAVANRHTRLANFLIWKGASLLIQNKWGRNVLDYARGYDQIWDVVVLNIRGLKGARHREKAEQESVVEDFERAFAKAKRRKDVQEAILHDWDIAPQLQSDEHQRADDDPRREL